MNIPIYPVTYWMMMIISDTDKHATSTHTQVINTHRLFCEHKSLVHLGKYLREALLDCLMSVLQNIMLCVCPGSAWRSENKLWMSVLSFFLLYGLWELNSGCQVQCIYLLGHLTDQINILLFFKETAKLSQKKLHVFCMFISNFKDRLFWIQVSGGTVQPGGGASWPEWFSGNLLHSLLIPWLIRK